MNARKVFTIVTIAILLTMAVSSTSQVMNDANTTQTDFQIAAPVGVQWEMTFGGPSNDRGQMILPATGGGFAVAGYTSSYGAGSDDTWFVLLDEDGAVLSNQTFGTTTYERAYDMCNTSDGGYALAGYQGLGSRDFYVVRLTSTGVLMWDNPYGTGSAEEVWSIIEDTDGYLVMAGFTTSNGGDARVAKINSTSGAEEWTFTYGGPGSQWGRGIVEVPGGYVVAGISDDWSVGGDDMWLFMIDYAGTLQWNKTYGTSETDYCFDLTKDPSGNLVLAGCQQQLSGTYDFWMIITDSMGNHISNHTFGGTANEQCQRIIPAADGSGFLLAGYTGSYGEGGDDMYMIRTDNAGVLMWEITNGTSRNDRAEGVAALSDGGFIITGYTDTVGSGWEMRGVRLWFDNEPPEFFNLPYHFYMNHGEILAFQVDAVDYSGIRNWWVNDTQFSVTPYGFITNTTTLDVGTYYVQVNVMDRYYNFESEVLTIEVQEAPVTTTTSTTTTTTSNTPTVTTEPTPTGTGTIVPVPDVGMLLIGGSSAGLILGIVVWQLLKKQKK